MDGWIWGLVGALGALLLLCAVLLSLLVRARRRERTEVAELREEIRHLSDRMASRGRATTGPVSDHPEDPEFVITAMGEQREPLPVAPDRVVLSATLGQPLVMAVALGHGVRRALAPQTRNRIRFEMRREVKRARKVRRREMREAWREMKTRRTETDDSSLAELPGETGRDVA